MFLIKLERTDENISETRERERVREKDGERDIETERVGSWRKKV